MLVMLIVGLMLISDLAYPTSRLIFYSAMTNGNENYYNTSAVLGAIFSASLNIALWLFAIKMWALS